MPKNKDVSPPVAVFKDRERIRCTICSDQELSTWIRDSLKATKDAGAPKPAASTVHRGSLVAFGLRMPRHENSTRSHLAEHEEYWIEWVEEADTVPR